MIKIITKQIMSKIENNNNNDSISSSSNHIKARINLFLRTKKLLQPQTSIEKMFDLQVEFW